MNNKEIIKKLLIEKEFIEDQIKKNNDIDHNLEYQQAIKNIEIKLIDLNYYKKKLNDNEQTIDEQIKYKYISKLIDFQNENKKNDIIKFDEETIQNFDLKDIKILIDYYSK